MIIPLSLSNGEVIPADLDGKSRTWRRQVSMAVIGERVTRAWQKEVLRGDQDYQRLVQATADAMNDEITQIIVGCEPAALAMLLHQILFEDVLRLYGRLEKQLVAESSVVTGSSE